MFNRNQLLIGILVLDLIAQSCTIRKLKDEYIKQRKTIMYLITMLEEREIFFTEFDVIALSDLGLVFKES